MEIMEKVEKVEKVEKENQEYIKTNDEDNEDKYKYIKKDIFGNEILVDTIRYYQKVTTMNDLFLDGAIHYRLYLKHNDFINLYLTKIQNKTFKPSNRECYEFLIGKSGRIVLTMKIIKKPSLCIIL